MPRGDTGTLAYGFLTLEEPPLAGVAAALEESLEPGTAITRYDRTWRFGQWTLMLDGQVIVGRMGFESRDAPTEVWNERVKDFRVQHPRLGQTSQFAINRTSLRVAFQLRGQTIRPQTFRGNFLALLREAAGHRWKFDLEGVGQPSWEDWLGGVSRLTKLRVVMRPPNPRFNDEEIESLFEEAKSSAVELALTGGEDGLDIQSSDFVIHAIEHARQYGTYEATGVVEEEGEEVKDTWKLSREGEVATAPVPQNPATREIDPRLLAATVTPVTQEPPRFEVAPESEVHSSGPPELPPPQENDYG